MSHARLDLLTRMTIGLQDCVLIHSNEGRGAVLYCGNFSPACSATMYPAYQSGHFSSICPVRFSCSPWAAAAR